MKAKRSNKKEKMIKGIIIVILSLILLYGAATLLEFIVSKSSIPDYNYTFYEIDPKLNIFEDPEYLEKDTSIHYTNELGETVATELNDKSNDIGVSFFTLYFFAVQQGDAETYNMLFSDRYYETHDEIKDFTMQRVYDIKLKFISEEEKENGDRYISYSLEYNIQKNDGTFRRDIGSDMSRTQYVTLFCNSDGIWIDELKTEYVK